MLRPKFKDIIVAIKQIKLPTEWRKMFIEAGIKEEELNSESDNTNYADLVSTMIDIAIAAIPIAQKRRPTLEEIIKAKENLRPIQPSKLPNLSEFNPTCLKNLKDIICLAINYRRKFISGENQSTKSSILLR